MKIKKYIVREIQDAMRLIREDMGPEAVIISSYPLPRRSLLEVFSPRQLEVTAALDDIKSPGYRLPVKGVSGFLPGQEVKSVANFNSILMQEEAGMELNNIERWRRYLLETGVQKKMVEHLLSDLENEVPETFVERDEYLVLLLKGRIASLLEPFYSKEEDALVYFFIGPTGMGKTTTMAKLATRWSLFDRKRVALIAVSNRCLNIEEELETCARITEVSLEKVMTSPELAAAVHRQSDKDIILVDTEGIPSKNTGQLLKLKGMLDAIEQPKEVFLVLSANTGDRDLYRIITDYDRVGFSKIIFTKFDETDTYGSFLNVVCQTEKPVSYVAYGQNIPDDLWLINPKDLANLLLKGVQEGNGRDV
jgi:flagellar biosynthesis protein FlhF